MKFYLKIKIGMTISSFFNNKFSGLTNFSLSLVEDDMLSTPNDLNWLYQQIQNNVIYFKIFPNMGHASFLIGKSVDWFNIPLNIIEEKFKFSDNSKSFNKGIQKTVPW